MALPDGGVSLATKVLCITFCCRENEVSNNCLETTTNNNFFVVFLITVTHQNPTPTKESLNHKHVCIIVKNICFQQALSGMKHIFTKIIQQGWGVLVWWPCGDVNPLGVAGSHEGNKWWTKTRTRWQGSVEGWYCSKTLLGNTLWFSFKKLEKQYPFCKSSFGEIVGGSLSIIYVYWCSLKKKLSEHEGVKRDSHSFDQNNMISKNDHQTNKAAWVESWSRHKPRVKFRNARHPIVSGFSEEKNGE